MNDTKTDNMPTLYNIKEAAEVSGFSWFSIRRAISGGRLKTIQPTGKRIYIKREDLLNWMNHGEVKDE